MNEILDFFNAHIDMVYVVILSIILGIEVIESVPSVLHTPLMSGANAIHGVVIVGAIIIMGKADPDNFLALVLGIIAVILGTLNVVGGFVVTDRMLDMFKSKNSNKYVFYLKRAHCIIELTRILSKTGFEYDRV